MDARKKSHEIMKEFHESIEKSKANIERTFYGPDKDRLCECNLSSKYDLSSLKTEAVFYTKCKHCVERFRLLLDHIQKHNSEFDITKNE